MQSLYGPFDRGIFRQKLNFTGKMGDVVVTYTVHRWLVGKRVVDVLFVLIDYVSLAHTVEAL